MNNFALQLRSNLPEKNRSLYKALKKSGRLDQYCQQKGIEAAEHMDRLIQIGMRDYEAKEIVIKELYEL